MKKLIVFFVLAFWTAASFAWADVIIEESVVPSGGGAPQTAKFYITPTRLALSQGTNGLIFLSDKQVLWQYDTEQHLYIEFTPESMKGLKAQSKAMISRAVDSLKKQLDSAPADQKPAIQKTIDQIQRGPVFSFKRLAGEKSVAGYSCVPIDVLVDGVSSESEYLLEGRWYGQAPGIDGVTYLADGQARPGDLVRARVTQGSDYDLAASLEL